MAQIKADEITQLLREQIANYDSKVQVDEVGDHHFARRRHCPPARPRQGHGRRAAQLPARHCGPRALSLEEDQVGAVILGDYTELKRRRRGQAHRQDSLACPWAPAMIGRVVNALGAAHRRQGPHRHHRNVCLSSAWLPASSTASPCASPWLPGSRQSMP